jgi:hypothetical protein
MSVGDLKIGPEKPEGVPIGAYTGTFVGIEEVPANVEKDYGPGYLFQWKIDAGPYAGRIVPRTTGQKIHAKTNCGKMLSALAGRQLPEGETFRLSDYVGRRYTIVVAAGPNGGTRVETVAPLPSN